VADRIKMEGHCSTGQSPQWAVVPMEEEVVMERNVSEYLGFAVPNTNPLLSAILFRYGKLFEVI